MLCVQARPTISIAHALAGYPTQHWDSMFSSLAVTICGPNVKSQVSEANWIQSEKG